MNTTYPGNTQNIGANSTSSTQTGRQNTKPAASPCGRLGLHYYPDTLHFCEKDLQTWLGQTKILGASWLVLESDATRAIPEAFLRGLLEAGVLPVLNFRIPIDTSLSNREMVSLFEVYARWGVRHVILFDRPNSRAAWSSAGWAQQDLVERFVDRFAPLADGARLAGLSPVFPPLEPGGEYWDTAFLRTALVTLMRRKQEALLSSLCLSAYAWTHSHALNWGTGGPDRWPTTRPYHTPIDSQDQKGFRVFDWYRAVTETVLGTTLPIFLLQAGAPSDMRCEPVVNQEVLSKNLVDIARQLNTETVIDPIDSEKTLAPIPDEVMGAFFWLPGAPDQEEFQIVTGRLREWAAHTEMISMTHSAYTSAAHPIPHYLLLPIYEWGVSDWHLEAIRPFLRKYRPTVGFSVEEAGMAARVTVIGTEEDYPEDTLQQLRQSGCRVERIAADGTNLASILAER